MSQLSLRIFPRCARGIVVEGINAILKFSNWSEHLVKPISITKLVDYEDGLIPVVDPPLFSCIVKLLNITIFAWK